MGQPRVPRQLPAIRAAGRAVPDSRSRRVRRRKLLHRRRLPRHVRGRTADPELRYTAVGTPVEIRSYLDDFTAACRADELILVRNATDSADRVRSVELTAAAMREPARR